MKKDLRVLFCLLIILALAAFFRLWQLNSIPSGLYPDEAINGNEALLSPGKIFYPENNGREGLFINLISLSFSIFGTSVFSLRLVAAIIGILTVFGLYLFTKELFQYSQQSEKCSQSIALLASFFLALSFWHTNFSRIGFRAILVPFVLVFSFYFLLRGFKKGLTSFPQAKNIWNFVIAGIFFGLGFYTYTVFRLAVLLVMVFLFFCWQFYKKKNLKKIFLILSLCFLLTTFIIALPLAIYFLNYPQNFVARASGVSIFAQNNNPPISQIRAFATSLIKHLGMFNFAGDYNWRHNISGSPILFWPVGILFLIGLGYSFWRIFQKKSQNTFPYKFLISFWFMMLLPSILTIEGVPHSLRSIGAIPPVFIFGAIGGGFLFSKIKKLVKIKKNFVKFLLFGALILLFLSFAWAQYFRYFDFWAKNPEVKGAFTERFVDMGNYLNQLDPEVEKYVIVNEPGVPVPYSSGLPVLAQTVQFIERTKFSKLRSVYLLPENLDQIKIDDRKTVILPMKYDENLLNQLTILFPQGDIEEKDGVWIYKINF